MSPVGKQEEASRVAEELLADIELQRLKASEVVLKASRVARLVGHEDLTEFLGYERNGYPLDGSANRWIGRAGRWAGRDDAKIFPGSISTIEANLAGSTRAIDAMRGGGNYSGEWAGAAARDHDTRIRAQAEAVGALSAICGQVVATVYDFVAEIYHELLFSDLQASLFADTQARVDGSLAAASGSALAKIERVSARLRDGDPESVSQGLTTCRRLIDSCADFVFPPRPDEYDMGAGLTLKVGQPNVLNRLQAFTHLQGAPKGRRDRLRRTLADLYDRCSAGTHADVTIEEARFVFLQTYVALGEVLTLGEPSGPAGPTPESTRDG